MAWWGWLVIGLFLMGAEMLGVDAAFYLMFIGFSAVTVGLLELLGLSMPVWVQWVLFSVLALGSMVTFRKTLYTKMRGNSPGFVNTDIGEVVVLENDLRPGENDRIQLRGSRWTATNVGTDTILAGAKARVVEASGLRLKISSISDSVT